MIEGFANAIKSCNYQQMLERGFAVLKDKNNHLWEKRSNFMNDFLS